jgi:transmembrane sensor
MGAILAGVALACAAVLAAPAVLIQLKSDYTTTTGELRTVLLDDGSEVILAPQSAIAVTYAAAERRIELLQGMAFFSVRKNAARPFRVQAGTLQTTVLGTRFEVRRAGDGASVAVEEGLVALSDSLQPSLDEKLAAGQAASVTASGQLTRGGQAGIAPWRQRLLLADDRPVGDAVADLARYYSGRIVIADAAVVQRRVTGVYGLDDPEATLRDIACAIGADVHRLSPWLLIVTSK